MKKVALAITLSWLVSCRDTPGIEEHEFHYYPSRNVYYDVEGQKFFYSVDGGESWKEVKTPAEPKAMLGEMVVVSDTGRQIFARNAAHRKLYNGVLFNFAAADTGTSLVAEVSERKITKAKMVTTVQKPAEKPKKGIGKFFSRIFGKKHKKD